MIVVRGRALALCAALPIVLVAVAHAQGIQGRIVDASTRTPIPAARITLLSQSGRALTTRMSDSLGEFEMPVPRDDSLSLKVESIGYLSLATPRFVVERGQLLDLEVRMSASAVPVEPLVVVARNATPLRLREFFRRADLVRKTGLGKVWLREDLEHVNSVRAILRSVIMRPAIGCSGSKILVDDLPVESHELDMINVDELEGIEIYHDPMEIPIEYGQLCNLVLIWRKPYGEWGRPLTWRRLIMVAGLAAVLFFLVSR